MIDWDDKQIIRFTRELETFASKSIPYAVREAINKTAFEAQGIAREEIAREMILKNAWTKRSIQVQTARGTRIESLQAEIGSTEEYMATQEDGGTKTKRGKHGVAIPTSRAAGQGARNPRTRMVRRRYLKRNLRMLHGTWMSKGPNPKARLMRVVHESLRRGRPNAYVEFSNGKKGIVEIVGSKGASSAVSRGWPAIKSLNMLYDLSHTSVSIPATKWLEESVDHVLPRLTVNYRRALFYQIERTRARLG